MQISQTVSQAKCRKAVRTHSFSSIVQSFYWSSHWNRHRVLRQSFHLREAVCCLHTPFKDIFGSAPLPVYMTLPLPITGPMQASDLSAALVWPITQLYIATWQTHRTARVSKAGYIMISISEHCRICITVNIPYKVAFAAIHFLWMDSDNHAPSLESLFRLWSL